MATGSQNLTGHQANKLTNPRELYVDLATTRNANSKILFDGTADKILQISGTLQVEHGGTERTTLTKNAILYGNDTAAVGLLASANGAVYATAANGALSFGTLPTGQGGTGNTSYTASRLVYSNTATKLATGNIVSEGNYISKVTYLTINADHQTSYRFYVNDTGKIPLLDGTQMTYRHLDAGKHGVSTDHQLYIGYGARTYTDMIRMYYSTGSSDSVSGRTEFFRINSNGSYALTRLGVNGQSTSYTLYVSGTAKHTDRLYQTNWIEFTDNTGLYLPSSGSGTHFYPANDVSYGSFQMQGTKGGYRGITMGASNNDLTIMSNSNDEGLYNAAAGRWAFFYHRSTEYCSIMGTSNSGWLINLCQNTYCYGAFYSGDIRGGNVRLTSNWVGFYQNANAGGSRYGYIQADANRMYYRKENGVSTYHHDFNGHIYASSNLYAGGSVLANNGLIYSTYNGVQAVFGAQNSSWVHFTNNGGKRWYFGNAIHVDGSVVIYNTNTSLSNNNLTFAQGGGWYMSDTTWVRTVSSKSVYTGGGTIRSDAEIWGDQLRMVDNWLGFYSATAGGTRYGYLQVNSTKYYFRKENGADTWPFDFNGSIYTTGRVYINNTTDVTPNASTGALVIGNGSGESVGIDNNEIMARNGGSASTLYINSEGGHVQIGTYGNTSYRISTDGLISSDWLRTAGNCGWYSESYGGGWYMYDTTWVRVYNNKSVYTSGTIRGDATVQSRRFESWDGGVTYLGHSNNASWVYTQDICSHSGNTYWKISVDGTAMFGDLTARGAAWIHNSCTWRLHMGGNNSNYGWIDFCSGTTRKSSILGYDGYIEMYPLRVNGEIQCDVTCRLGCGSNSMILRYDGSYLWILPSNSKGFGATWSATPWRVDRSGNQTCTSVTQTSSYLIKENIYTYNDSLYDKFMKLRVVNFNFKKRFGSTNKQVGLIAEEVQKLFPSLIYVPDNYNPAHVLDEKSPPLSLNYIGFIPYLIKMIQNQQQEIDELKNKIHQLK